MTRYEAFIEKSWRTTGLTQILVARNTLARALRPPAPPTPVS